MNKTTIVLLLSLIMQVGTIAQNTIVMGRIFDVYQEPLPDVIVCQNKYYNCNTSGMDGVFHILIDDNVDKLLTFSRNGFQTISIPLSYGLSSPLILTMLEDTAWAGYAEESQRVSKSKAKFGFSAALNVDVLSTDFDEFANVLGKYNTDVMNTPHAILSIEMGLVYKKIYAGFNWGFNQIENTKHDSLTIRSRTNQYGLHFGYHLLDTKRFLIAPVIAVKWTRFRLINSDKRRDIPLGTYLADRDLDLRFNQITADIAIRIAYKIYQVGTLKSDYWMVGIYGGYRAKLNDKPWIYSLENRLNSTSRIKITNFYYGVGFTLYIN